MDAGEPKIEGPIDPKATRRSLRSYSLSVRRCWFSKMPRNHPKGRLRLDLTVDAKGVVSKASLGAGTLKNNDIESCILKVARSWRFSPSKPRPSKISVEYTFSYRY
jgi:TonB family protein